MFKLKITVFLSWYPKTLTVYLVNMQLSTNLLGDFYLKAIKGVMVTLLQKKKTPPAAAGEISTQDWMEWWHYRSFYFKTLLVTTLFSEEGVWGFTIGPRYILLRRRQFHTYKFTSCGVIFLPLKPWALNWEQSPAGGAVQWRGGGRAGSRWTGWGGCLRPGGLSDCAEEPSGFPQTRLSSGPIYLLT